MRQVIAGLFVLVFLIAAPAEAAHWDKFVKFCFADFIDVPEIIPEIPVPVGCEVVDCCPGCPGPFEFIDWRILVEKNAAGVQIRLDGMDERAIANLKFRGNVTREGSILNVGPGESFITGLPNAKKGSVAVGVVKVMPNKEAAPQANAADAATGAAADTGNDADANGVEIYQMVGKYTVNRFRSKLRFIECFGPIFEDRIQLSNNTSNDSAVILADFRRNNACQNDLFFRTATSAGIGNAVLNGVCNSEVSVFSDDNAMSFQPNVNTWTNAIGDVHNVALQRMVVAPVTVWLARAGALAQAQNDFANANMLYNQNNTGIRFNAAFNDVSGDPNAVNTIGGQAGDCNTAGALQGTAFHTTGAINIYYVNGAFTGVNCGANRNVSFLGTTANLGSLPHEIGHAYSLRPSAQGGHTNGLPGFGNDNIMFGGGPATRDHFSVGQAFRLNVATTSQLNVNGNRVGPTRACVPLDVSNLCPALALDSLPH